MVDPPENGLKQENPKNHLLVLPCGKSPMGMMRYFQACERCPCKEALYENTESNWTDARCEC